MKPFDFLNAEQSNPAAFVLEFSKIMETKLRENSHKGGFSGWCHEPVYFLLRRLDEEVKELRAAVNFSLDNISATDKIALIQREAADVANFAMMIASWYSEAGFRARRGTTQIVMSEHVGERRE